MFWVHTRATGRGRGQQVIIPPFRSPRSAKFFFFLEGPKVQFLTFSSEFYPTWMKGRA